MEIQELIQTSYENSKAKGWYDDGPPDFSMRLALILSELAEALEEHRHGRAPNEIWFKTPNVLDLTPMERARRGEKPEGIIVEATDVVIRLGDMSGYYGFKLGSGRIATRMECKPEFTEPTTFGQWHNSVARWFLEAEKWFTDYAHLTREQQIDAADADLVVALSATLAFVRWLGITGEEFESAIRIKWAFNLTRPYRHGNKVA